MTITVECVYVCVLPDIENFIFLRKSEAMPKEQSKLKIKILSSVKCQLTNDIYA